MFPQIRSHKILVFISKRVWSLGRKPICNLRPDRAPRLFGICFPLCWRCTGIILGVFLAPGFLSCTFVVNISTIHGLALITPAAVDAVAQYAYGIESTNLRRVTTGAACGVGLVIFLKHFY